MSFSFPPPPPPGEPPPRTTAAGPYGYTNAPAYPKASWWARFVAFVIDGIIGNVMTGVGQLFLAVGPQEQGVCTDFTGFTYACDQPTTGTLVIGLALIAAGFVGFVVYYALMTASPRGATLGKRALGIRVVREETGESLTVARSVGRYFASWLSAIPLCLGFVWAAWDARGQTWHDKIVGSRVIKAD